MSGSAGSTSSGSILKEFFVSLSYMVNGQSEKNITESLDKTAGRFAALAKRAALAAASIVTAIALIAKAMEDLYYASRRTGAAEANIRAFSHAVSQLGGTSAGALSSLENFARFLRSSPGAFQFIERMGVQTRDAAGNLRDTSEVLLDVGAKLRDMPRYRANIYAETLGIDELTLNALIDGTNRFSAEYREMAQAMGIDSKKAAEGGRDFTRVLRSLFMAMDLMRLKYNQELAGPLGQQLVRLTKVIVENADLITRVLTNASMIVLKVATFIISMMLRAAEGLRAVMRWFHEMPAASQRLVAALAILGVAWKALSMAFGASPLGRLLILMTAFLLLLEDYQTFTEGGESAIDWGAWEPQIDMVRQGLKALTGDFEGLAKILDDNFGGGFTRWLRDIGRSIMETVFPALKKMGGIVADLLEIDHAMSNWDVINMARATRNLMRRVGLNSTERESIPGRPGTGPEADPPEAPRRGAGQTTDEAGRPSNPNLTPAGQTFLNLIGGAEGTDGARGYNETYGFGRYSGGERDLTGMTMAQIDQMQTEMLRHRGNGARSSAAGRYQIVQTTLRGLRQQLRIGDDEKYTPEMQDRLAMELLKQRGLEQYQRGEITAEQFINNLAQEWASIPRADTGQGHYEGQRRPGVSLPAVRAGIEAFRQPAPNMRPPLVPGPPMPSGPIPERGEEPGRNPSIRTGDVTINVNGTGSPGAVADRVLDGQGRVQADIIRNARGALR